VHKATQNVEIELV